MAQRLQKSAAFDVDFHGSFDCRPVPEKAPPGPRPGHPEALDFLELLKPRESKSGIITGMWQKGQLGGLQNRLSK